VAVAAPETPPILRYGDVRLRRVCRAVADGEDVADLVAALAAAMRAAAGVGLAAPQLGDPRRVILCRDPDGRRREPLALINPVIEARAGPLVGLEEGCLSFPDLYLTIWRPRAVRVRYRDPAGRSCVLEDDALLGRIVLHEVDHLDGVLFVDRLPRWRRWLLAWRLRQLRRRTRELAA
jgi:peptide deformylase